MIKKIFTFIFVLALSVIKVDAKHMKQYLNLASAEDTESAGENGRFGGTGG